MVMMMMVMMMVVVVLPSAEMLSYILLQCRKEKSTISRMSYLHAYLNKGGLGLANEHSSSESRIMACFDRQELGHGSISEYSLGLYKRWLEGHLSLHQGLSCYAFVGLLKSCISTKDFVRGCMIHVEVVRIGLLEKNVFIGSILVDMYAKCGSLARSQEVFDILPVRNVVCWNVLIGGYIEHGYYERGLDMYKLMHCDGISSDDVTSLYGLKACSAIGDTSKNKEMHIEIVKKGFEEGNLMVGSALVDMYAKCGSIKSAQVVFSMLKGRNVVTWNSMIAAYLENGFIEEANDCLGKMFNDNVSPSAITYTCILRLYGAVGCLDGGMNIHGEVTSKAMDRDIVIGSTIVDMYVKCGSLSEAKDVFYKLDFRDVISWNALLAGFVQHNLDVDAISSFRCMQHEGVSPDEVTYMCMLRICGIEKGGWEIHTDIVQKGLEDNLFISQTLIQIYAKCGWLAEAQNEFNKTHEQTLVTWNALVQGYAEHGYYDKALNSIKKMQDVGISWNAATFLYSLQVCIHTEDRDSGLKFHADVLRKGLLESDDILNSVLIDMYAKFGSLVEMQVVFNSSCVRDLASWNSLMAGYAEVGCFHEPLNCFVQMQNEGITLDCIAFSCILKACAGSGAIDNGRGMHIDIVKQGLLDKDPFSLAHSLMDMYMKLGFLAEAQNVFSKLSLQDATLWTTLISGYMENGAVEAALKCFAEMQDESIFPLVSTFVHVLKACSRLGSIIMGQEIHAEIVCKGLEREPNLYTILVEMYAKCGYSAEAEALFAIHQDGDVIMPQVMLMGGFSEQVGIGDTNKCFEWMQRRNVSPGHNVFVFFLRACGRERHIYKGQEVHTEIVKKGLEILIGVDLVDMYVKSGFFLEAKKLFGELPLRTIVAWNALISGYLEHGYCEEVFCYFKQIPKEGISPDIVTLTCVLKSCISVGNTFNGHEVHTDIAKMGLEGELLIGNTLVDMYAKCGILEEANLVFDRLLVQTSTSWTALVSGYIECGHYDMGLHFYEQMQHKSISMNVVTYVSILKASSRKGSIEKGKEIHGEIIKKGILESDDLIGSVLVDMYVNCGFLEEARLLFDKLTVQDVIAWTTVMLGYVEQGYAQEALECFQHMQVKGILPDKFSLVSGLIACADIRAILRGRSIHMEIMKTGIEQDVTISNSLIDMYVDCGSLIEAEKVFDELRGRNAASWSALISGYFENGSNEEVFHCFQDIICSGIAPDPAAFVCIFRACGITKSPIRGQEAHGEVVSRGFEGDAVIGNTLVCMYAKCGLFLEARETFDKLQTRDVVSWNILIATYTEDGHVKEALHCFKQMQEHAYNNNLTLLLILIACASSGALDIGREIHLELIKKGLENNLRFGNSLIDMYVKCASLSMAKKVFESLPSRDVVSWNAIITGYAQLGESENVFSMFDKMISEAVKPDLVTFLCLLTSCNHAGLIDEGEMYFDSMENDYGLTPSTKHYNCIVDLFGRAGRLDAAMLMAKKMPFQPGDLVWQTILGACRKWGHVELGQHAFEHAIQLHDPDTSIYVCMSNIYMDAAMKEDVNEI